MNIVILNGSPRSHGCTATALREVEKGLHKYGIETEWHQLGTGSVRGCIACQKCYSGNGCIFDDDAVNPLIERITRSDGLIIGSPVYYASPNGSLIALLDRVFYAGGNFSGKVGAAIVSARRAGTTSALDVLYKYFMISNMPVVSGRYWPMVHGNTPQETAQDLEGLQIMRSIGENMAWLLRCVEAGNLAGIELPIAEPKIATNFIR